MASPYYVDSTATAGDNTGGSWANAFETFAQAVTAATTAGDIIYVSHAHSESLAADTTYTFGANVRVLCVNSGTDALATTAVIGAQADSYSIQFSGAKICYFYGLTLRINGSTLKYIGVNRTDGASSYFENCRFELLHAQSGPNGRFFSGTTGSSISGFVQYVGCVWKFTSSQSFALSTSCEFVNCSVDAASTAGSGGFGWQDNDVLAVMTGCDWSAVAATLFANSSSASPSIRMANCKLASGQAIKQSAVTWLHKGNVQVWAYNCAAGDTHYALYHGDAFGETTVSATIYANDGASYDGTNRCSWKIVTTANCNYYYPYVSPWFDVYHSGTSAITPRIEILRDGSATEYQDDEVWGEWSYQGTSGFPLATIVSDRMMPLGSAADQAASALGAGDWTGENATAAFQKLEATAAFTPAEIGHLRARVCVGQPEITVYVDPTIRTT